MSSRHLPLAGSGRWSGDEEGTATAGAIRRRAFLQRAGRASLGMLCSGVVLPLTACAGVHYATATRVDGALRVSEAEFGESDAVLIENPEDARPIFLRRTGDGSYTAVSTRCAHRGCQVLRRGDRLACPCHGSEYRLDGELLEGPADRPLRRFRTRVRDGAVLIFPEPRGESR